MANISTVLHDPKSSSILSVTALTAFETKSTSAMHYREGKWVDS